MTVKLVLKSGAGIVYVGDKVAERMLKTGMYRKYEGSSPIGASTQTEKKAEEPVQGTEETPESEHTPEDVPKLPEATQSQEGTPDANAVREWAQANGVEVSQRGRVAQQVYDAFAEAHKE